MGDKFRNTGRTTRLIVSHLKKVLRHHGESIKIYDHAAVDESTQVDQDLYVAKRVSEHLKFLGVEHDLNENRILVHSIKKRDSHAH